MVYASYKEDIFTVKRGSQRHQRDNLKVINPGKQSHSVLKEIQQQCKSKIHHRKIDQCQPQPKSEWYQVLLRWWAGSSLLMAPIDLILTDKHLWLFVFGDVLSHNWGKCAVNFGIGIID